MKHDGIVTELAALPARSTLDATALAGILGLHKKSVQRAVRRGELPQPFRFGGKHCWLAGAVLDFFEAKQAAAQQEQERRMVRLSDHQTRLAR